MSRKSKFRPKVTRIKLNPEQAVLSCACYVYGRHYIQDTGTVTNRQWLSYSSPEPTGACWTSRSFVGNLQTWAGEVGGVENDTLNS